MSASQQKTWNLCRLSSAAGSYEVAHQMTIGRHLRAFGHLPTSSAARFATAYLPSSGYSAVAIRFLRPRFRSSLEGQAEVIVLFDRLTLPA